MQWFRFYTEVLNDPKVQRLQPHLFKLWVNLLCVANNGSPRGHITGDLGDLAFVLHMSEEDVSTGLHDLESAKLLEKDGDGWRPHGWRSRQPDWDDATARSKRSKERSRDRSEERSKERSHERSKERTDNVPVHVLDTDTDTDTDTEKYTPPTPPPGASRVVRPLQYTDNDLDAAKLLELRIRENFPKAKIAPRHVDQWANEIRLMREQDGRDPPDIVAVIEWCQRNTFWRSNILSGKALRKQFDRLQARMTEEERSGQAGGRSRPLAGPKTRPGRHPSEIDWDEEARAGWT